MMPQVAFDGLHAAFDWTWRTSLETSVLIVLVLLTQCLWGRRLSAQGHYLLGLLILLRLATPTVPSSDFSALNLTRYWKTPSARTAPITSIADVPIARRTTALETRPMITDAPPSTAFAANSRRFVPWAWVWALGVATLLCAALIRHRRCARWIRHQISLTEPWVLSALATASKRDGRAVRDKVSGDPGSERTGALWLDQAVLTRARSRSFRTDPRGVGTGVST